MGIQMTCVDCDEAVTAGQIHCPSCDDEVTLRRLREGIARLTRSVQTATQLGLFEEMLEFRAMLDEDRRILRGLQ